MKDIITHIDPNTVQGTEDIEDTKLQLWRADSEDNLYNQAQKEYCGGVDDSMAESLSEDFESDWGIIFLPTI